MNEFIDTRLAPPLLVLADWSLRWGVLLVGLAVWLRFRPPRGVHARALACRLALLGGLALPLLPALWSLPRFPVERTEAHASGGPTPLSIRGPAVTGGSTAGGEQIQGPAPIDPAPVPDEEPPSDPQPEPMGVVRWAVLALAAVWLLGVAGLGGRLVVGWLLLVCMRRSAVPAGPEAEELLRQCQAELGLRRPVELRTHPAVRSPAVVGCGRACVFVPTGWRFLSAETQRLCLLHELLHLVRRDHWARLGEELVRIGFFFHPLVRWLLDRLDGERERLCDAELVRRGVAPRRLAEVLAEFARRVGPGRSVVDVAAAVPFFHRVTVKDRIFQLLEDDMNSWITPLSYRRAALLGAAVLGLVVALGGVGARNARTEGAPPPAAPGQPDVPRGREAPLQAKLVDSRGKPLAGARVVGLCRAIGCVRLDGPPIVTDAAGRFRLDRAPDGPLTLGATVSLQVQSAKGQSFEVHTVVSPEEVEVRVPTLVQPAATPPAQVEVGELAGVVVDDEGRPLEGVDVDVWDWYPGNETETGKDGVFRLKGLGRDTKVQVRFRKEGWSPVMFMQQPTGVAGWVVAMDRKTYFEGTVRGPDGRPAAGAVIRADQGPKQMDGGINTHIWTDGRADAAGRYRLYVQPDEYEFHVKAPGVGVARLPKTGVVHGQARRLDIPLSPGVTFRAAVVDSASGKPVAGVRLWAWEHKGLEGRSDANGKVVIRDMLPGRFEFQVDAAGYARWWSAEAVSEWNRRPTPSARLGGWVRNFDSLDYLLHADMPEVKIVVEKGVRVRGRVVDPDGKPVAGATAAPALTGTGNSLTGDTRFSVETKADGSFEMLLPAGNGREYNLVAHDGKYGQWRKWANGVLPPIQTKPGQVIEGVTLTLTRPATVRGRVVDAQGKPVPFREVRAHAADLRENRYYDPTTTTREDGTFELKLIRAGEQYIQAAPFWLSAAEAPAESTKKLNLKEGETLADVRLVGVDPMR